MNEDKSALQREAVAYFGSRLMENARDLAIVLADKMVAGQMKPEDSQRVGQLFASLDARQMDAVHRLIPYVVDEVFFMLMRTLDADKNIRVSVQVEEGIVEDLRDASDDLYLEVPGWIGDFSKQRSNTFANI